MKKIAILSAVNVKHMSLISIYTEELKKLNINFDLIYMDKYNIEEEFDANNIFKFVNLINHEDSKLLKILQYFKFRKYAIKKIKENNYDFVIVWNDVAILMFADFFAKKMKNKYCLNIRDYCGEKNKFIYNRFKKAILNSAFTTISSDGFLSFLPHYDYISVHSMNLKILQDIPVRNNFREPGSPIRITFIGNVRFFDMNKKIMDVFKNDERFTLGYYGINSEILKEYADKNDIKNVDFFGSFPVEQTKEFIEKSDIINNLYGNENIALTSALSIKLYYGVYMNLPILCSKSTFSSELIEKYGIGFSVDVIDNNLPNELYQWYSSLSFNEFSSGICKLKQKIIQSQEDLKCKLEMHVK